MPTDESEALMVVIGFAVLEWFGASPAAIGRTHLAPIPR
jgi:hypothetical protein